jgi:hypothetical protein
MSEEIALCGPAAAAEMRRTERKTG